MIQAFEEGVRFGCTQCGECCTRLKSDIALSHDDVTRISRHLGLSVQTFVRDHGVHFVAVIRQPGRALELPLVALRVPKSGRCVFLDGSGRCSIHEVKPFLCSHSPFMAYVAEGAPSVWQEAVSYCPGVGRGDRYDREQIARSLGEERDLEEEDFARLEEHEGDLERIFGTRLPERVVLEVSLASEDVNRLVHAEPERDRRRW